MISKNLKKKSIKILVMGLPGSGKTTLSKILKEKLNADYINADEIRKKFNDWDFSIKGRLRQARRMAEIANQTIIKNTTIVADFVCPVDEARKIFNADFLIWMNTIKKGRYDDTNSLFQTPKEFDFKVETFDAEIVSKKIISEIEKKLF